jgi:hypothetical protein
MCYFCNLRRPFGVAEYFAIEAVLEPKDAGPSDKPARTPDPAAKIVSSAVLSDLDSIDQH